MDKLIKSAFLASLDQLDQMLFDYADKINELAKKEIDQWETKDFLLIKFCIHAVAARAVFIKTKREL